MPYDRNGKYYGSYTAATNANKAIDAAAAAASKKRASGRIKSKVTVTEPTIEIYFETQNGDVLIDEKTFTVTQASKLFDILAEALEKVGERNAES